MTDDLNTISSSDINTAKATLKTYTSKSYHLVLYGYSKLVYHDDTCELVRMIIMHHSLSYT